jgi:hypothetical protein
MDNHGNCSLIIRGSELNFKEIENNLKVTPSRVVKKKEIISELVGESEYDLWVYEMKLDDVKKLNQILTVLLLTLNPCKAYMQNVSNYSDVRIKCYIQSDYAQINFELLPDIIKELANMEIKLEFSILSWGGVDP